MKVNTTKVETNITMIVLEILLLLTLVRCLQKLLLFIVSSLMILFKSYLTYSLLVTVKNITGKGSQLIVALTCPNNHENIWKSQPTVNQYSQNNLTFSMAVLFSANMPTSPTFNGLQKLATMQFKGNFSQELFI